MSNSKMYRINHQIEIYPDLSNLRTTGASATEIGF